MSGKTSYAKLDVETFGEQLIKSGDLDPVYIGLTAWEPDDATKAKWLLAYWCFYHCGVAGYLSELSTEDYWEAFHEAVLNKTESPVGGRWPRAKERRHFRGANAEKAYAHLRERYDDPEQMLLSLVSCAPSFREVTRRVESHVGFGPWMGFKVADMIDRCLGVHVDFETEDVFLFKDPEAAALMVWKQFNGYPDSAKVKDKKAAVAAVVDHLSQKFRDLTAPPYYDRPVGVQEIETVLCKWKSHINGSYPVNNDLVEISQGLDGWGKNAALFGGAMMDGCRLA